MLVENFDIKLVFFLFASCFELSYVFAYDTCLWVEYLIIAIVSISFRAKKENYLLGYKIVPRDFNFALENR